MVFTKRIDRLAQQVELLWLQQTRWRASVDAMGHVLDALIITHPNPGAIRDFLQDIRQMPLSYPMAPDDETHGKAMLDELQAQLRHYETMASMTCDWDVTKEVRILANRTPAAND